MKIEVEKSSGETVVWDDVAGIDEKDLKLTVLDAPSDKDFEDLIDVPGAFYTRDDKIFWKVVAVYSPGMWMGYEIHHGS